MSSTTRSFFFRTLAGILTPPLPVVVLLLLTGCATARPSPTTSTRGGAMEALRRARDLHWSVQVYADDSVQAEGRAALLGGESASVGGVDVAYADIDSIYRWSPEVSTFSKSSAVTGAAILGGIGVFLAGICGDEWLECAVWAGGAGAAVGAFIGASVGELLSPVGGAWEVLWREAADD